VQTCTPTGERELYDLQNDPYELTNLSGNNSYAATETGLGALLNRLSSCVGASCRIE
jgi:hypothetical protein